MLVRYKAIITHFQHIWRLSSITSLEIPLEVSDKVKRLPVDTKAPFLGVYPQKRKYMYTHTHKPWLGISQQLSL